MNTALSTTASPVTAQARVQANTRALAPGQHIRRPAGTRFAAGLASVLTSASLLASVVGGFGAQADGALLAAGFLAQPALAATPALQPAA